MNPLNVKTVFVFLLAALIAPQLQHNHPILSRNPIHPLSAAASQTEIVFAGDLSSPRLTFDVSRLTFLSSQLTHLLREAVSAVTAPSLSEARHA